jgi:signal transduction histidine kinase
LVSLSFLVLQNGFSTGSFFYFFPIALTSFINIIESNLVLKFRPFLFTILFFILLLAIVFLFPSDPVVYNSLGYLFFFRLTVTILICAILIRHLHFVYKFKKDPLGRKNISDTLFESQQDGYLVFGKESKIIVDYNPRIVSLFGLEDVGDIKGLFVSQFMMRYLAANSVNLDILMNSIPVDWCGEGNFRNVSKKEFTGQISSAAYFNDETAYQILIIRDITNIKEIENALRLNREAMEYSTTVKSRFLSSISHELRTPLNGITGITNLIIAEKNLSESIKNNLQLQLYSCDHMLSIINDILDFSKIESGKMEFNKSPFNLLVCMQNLVKSFENQFRKNEIELEFRHDIHLADINIISDEVKLRQVINNLLSNALKFTFVGKVTLSVSVEALDSRSYTILFSVKDTGIGIKKEKHREIFEGFNQVHVENLNRRFGGTGLGLSISEKLVNLFGSTINLESELGKGACFYFTLNFEKQQIFEPKIENTESIVSQIDIRGVRILIVEDNEINVSVLKGFLNKWGIVIKEASNGIHALELLKYHRFDLILMDLEMPEMNGYTAAKIIRQTNTEIPIIAFTATLLESMDAIIRLNGFDGYVLKPFRPSDLKKQIGKFVPSRKIDYA